MAFSPRGVCHQRDGNHRLWAERRGSVSRESGGGKEDANAALRHAECGAMISQRGNRSRRPSKTLPERPLVEANGRPVKGIEKAFAYAVADAGLGPDVMPNVLRHTAATWWMQSERVLGKPQGFSACRSRCCWSGTATITRIICPELAKH